MTVAEKQREIKALDNKVKALEKELTLDKTLAEIKKYYVVQDQPINN